MQFRHWPELPSREFDCRVAIVLRWYGTPRAVGTIAICYAGTTRFWPWSGHKVWECNGHLTVKHYLSTDMTDRKRGSRALSQEQAGTDTVRLPLMERGRTPDIHAWVMFPGVEI